MSAKVSGWKIQWVILTITILQLRRTHEIWESNYDRLSQFCQTNRVPDPRRRLLTEDPKLYPWIDAQRHIYIKYNKLDIEISPVRAKRIERLKLLGFDITKNWDRVLEDERPSRRDDVGWDEYFDKLKQYWIENGNTYKHLWKKERRLSKWKDAQMDEYKKHGLRGNRRERLATIGILFPDAPTDAQADDGPTDAQADDGPPRPGPNDYVIGQKHLMQLYPNHQKLDTHLKRIDDEYRSSNNFSPFQRKHTKSTYTVNKKFNLKDQIREFFKSEMSRGVRFFQAK